MARAADSVDNCRVGEMAAGDAAREARSYTGTLHCRADKDNRCA
jgi:hypothetical protein